MAATLAPVFPSDQAQMPLPWKALSVLAESESQNQGRTGQVDPRNRAHLVTLAVSCPLAHCQSSFCYLSLSGAIEQIDTCGIIRSLL